MKTWRSYGIDFPESFSGEKVTTCPKCSHTRKKKKSKCLQGNGDSGLWICFHCDWRGSLAKGIEDHGDSSRWKSYRKPPEISKADLPEKAIKWFTKRGISEKTLIRNKIGYGKIYMPQLEEEVNAIQFPYFRKGQLVNVKYRDGKKNFRMHGGAERIFYGMDDVTGDTVLICEGEADKLSLEEAGYRNCISVPDGAPSVKAKNYEKKFDYLSPASEFLEKIKVFILAVDNDEPGQKLKEELARRLGKEKCKIAIWPDDCKDANEVLVKHSKGKLSDCIKLASHYPVKGIFELKDFKERVEYLYEHGYKRGEHPGWDNLNYCYTVRAGELTVVSGIPGHGKSSFIDNLIVNLAKNSNWPFGIYSPENQPLERHVAKLMEIFSGFAFWGKGRLPKENYEIAEWFIQDYFNFILPDPDENHSIELILDLAKVLVLRKGIKGLVIDPWNELDHSRPNMISETEYISEVLSKIRRFARNYGVHIWLIAHPTKLKKDKNGKYPVPTPYDVAGCHSSDTEVLTSNGWKFHQELSLKDKIACFDMDTNTLRYMKPTKIWQYDYCGEMYNLKSPSYDALVTPNHKLVVRPNWRNTKPLRKNNLGSPVKFKKDNGWNLIEAKNIKSSNLEMPWATTMESTAVITGKSNIIGYPTELFVQIIGWWIAEGWYVKGSGGLGLCQGVGKLAEKMKTTMKACGLNFTENIGPPGTNGTIPGWKAYIGVRGNRELCKWMPQNCGIGAKNKKIPNVIWGLPTREKELLLHALIEGDGSKGRGDNYKYSTISEKLSDDVQKLSIECGRMCSVLKREAMQAGHNDRYELNMGRINRKHILINDARNVRIKNYSGKVYCLTTPTGAYLIRRNGKLGIYGNSANFKNKTDNALAVWRDVKDKDKPVEVHIQKIRFKEIGQLGEVYFEYDIYSGRYTECQHEYEEKNNIPTYRTWT